MGWTTLHKTESTKEWFENNLTWEDEKYSNRPLKTAVYAFKREAYAAVERINKETGKREVWAAVFLLGYYPKSYYNFGYKDMCESMGPYSYNCPERILNLLTPTDSEDANEWRELCWERINRKKNQPKFKKGDIVEFEKPIRFTTGSQKRLFCHNKRSGLFRRVFENADGKLQIDNYGWVKLPRRVFDERKFKVLSYQAA
jgi:hypothetical protein